MNSKEEQRYMELRAKMQSELASIETQMDELETKRRRLNMVLDGSLGQPAIEGAEELVRVNRRKEERTEGRGNDEKAELDEQLIALLDREPGLERALIDNALVANGWSKWDIDKSLKRCKNRGAIVREGNTRIAKWYAAEEG
jgi:hypothetical protein